MQGQTGLSTLRPVQLTSRRNAMLRLHSTIVRFALLAAFVLTAGAGLKW
jgi:hypothetical protein